MKKILGVSITAMLAVCPILANAETVGPAAGVTYVLPTHTDSGVSATANPAYAHVGIDTDDQGHIASTAYVKGAYNSAISAINKVATTAAAGQTAEQVSSAISTALAAADGNGLSDNGSGALNVNTGDGLEISSNNVVVKLDGTTLAKSASGLKVNEITTSNIASASMAAATANSTYASEPGSGLLAQKGYVDEAIAAAGGQTAAQVQTAITNAAGDGLTGSNGVLTVGAGNGITVNNNDVAVNLDGTTLSVSASGLKVNEITTSNIASTSLVQATNTATYSGTQLAQKGYVDEAVASAAAGKVTADSTTTFTNKTFDANATGNSISNLEVADFANNVIVTTVGATGTNTALPTEAAVRSAINTATTGMATGTGVTATIAATTVSVPVFTTWGSDVSTSASVPATVTAATYTSGS